MPLYLCVALVYAVGRPIALVGLVPGSVLALWLGLRYTPVTAYVLFTVVALMAVPRNVRRPVQVLLVPRPWSSWCWHGCGRRPAPGSPSGRRRCSAERGSR